LARQRERRAHPDLQVNPLAEQESTKTMELSERIARQLNVPLPAKCERRVGDPARPTSTASATDQRVGWH
jgi:hypothetical protein